MAEMSPLRRPMVEDMTVRNLSPATQRSYLHAVTKFSRYFHAYSQRPSPDGDPPYTPRDSGDTGTLTCGVGRMRTSQPPRLDKPRAIRSKWDPAGPMFPG